MARVLTFRDRALQSKDTVELIAQKWRIKVLHLLRNGPLRTTELQSAITEISPKVLTETAPVRTGSAERFVGWNAMA